MTYSYPKKELIVYLLKFGGTFVFLYFGTLGIIGLSTPENNHSPFVADYLNYVDLLRLFLLKGAKLALSLFGYTSNLEGSYVLRLSEGTGIRMVYSCIGYGVMSFWTAFVIANKGKFGKKSVWIIGGLLVLSFINILRICILLVAGAKKAALPFGWDHHTFFNIAAYAAIFSMIYFYDRSLDAQ